MSIVSQTRGNREEIHSEHFFTWGGFIRVAPITASSRGYFAYAPWNPKNILDAAEERNPRATTVRRTKFASKLPILRRPMDTVGCVHASIERTGQTTCDLSARSQKHISWMYATWKSIQTRSGTLEEYQRGFNRLLGFPGPERQSGFCTIRMKSSCRLSWILQITFPESS